MFLNILILLGGITLLYAGAEGLVRGSSSLARRLKLTPLVIGLTVVAFGTSMPEMVVSVGAALSGTAPIAAGNVVGSNIANIALILGASAVLCPLAVNVTIVRLDLPLLVVVSFAMAGIVLDQTVGRLEGGLLVIGLIAYTSFSIRAARKEVHAAQTMFGSFIPAENRSLFGSAALLAGGLALLVIGARLLVTGAVAIAQMWGLSEAVIGLTIVAVGTSLPELATSIMAALKKEVDIAVGNIVGSNLFNLLGILGVSSLARPLMGTGMGRVDLGLMIALAVLLLPLARSGWKVTRWEGILLLFIYLGYVTYLLV